MDRDFAVFILSHGRADNVITYKTLKRQGYTGQVYIMIDDEDDQESRYRELYGEQVVQFRKADYDGTFDVMDTDKDRRVVVFARNAVFDVAKDLGLDYFVVLDDDYKEFQFRYEHEMRLLTKSCTDLDRLFDAMFAFLDASGAKAVALGQGGDLIGGTKSGTWKKQLLRKVMNVWFFRTDNRVEFIGRINEDTNTYVSGGIRGELFLSILRAIIVQVKTQAQAGGLTEAYLDMGTYRKSFYSVICAPSCVTIVDMGGGHRRMHHHVSWNNCCPKIISERYRKI